MNEKKSYYKKQAIKKTKKENYDFAKNGVFFCQPCWIAWDAEGMEANCPGCGELRQKVHHAYKSIIRCNESPLRGKHTEDGNMRIAQAVAERNQHMSDYQKKRIRLNGVKHGRYMVVSGVFPAKKDKYPDCKECEVYAHCNNSGYCVTKTDKIQQYRLKFLAAFKNGDIESLDDYAGEIQADTYAALKDMFSDLFQRGPVIEELIMNFKEDGGPEPVEVEDETGKVVRLKRIFSHPVLQHIPKFLEAVGFTADARKMTQKARGQITGDNLDEMIKNILGIKTKDEHQSFIEAGLEIDTESQDDENNDSKAL